MAVTLIVKNFDTEKVDSIPARDFIEQHIAKPSDNFYLVQSRQQRKRTMELHADDIVLKLQEFFSWNLYKIQFD